jgi:hypothetical protein
MIDLDLLVILDRSGSMQSRKTDHEGGVQSFLEDQRAMAGDVRLTFVQFDTVDPCEIVYDRVPLDAVAPIVLIPRGGTPLLDAVGRAVAHLQTAQIAAPATQTIVMVVTDGEENSSKEWTLAQVKGLVSALEQGGATVLFLGATLDTFQEAAAMGVAYAGTIAVPQAASNIAAAYTLTSNKVLRARAAWAAGDLAAASACMAYTDEERIVISTTEE